MHSTAAVKLGSVCNPANGRHEPVEVIAVYLTTTGSSPPKLYVPVKALHDALTRLSSVNVTYKSFKSHLVGLADGSAIAASEQQLVVLRSSGAIPRAAANALLVPLRTLLSVVARAKLYLLGVPKYAIQALLDVQEASESPQGVVAAVANMTKAELLTSNLPPALDAAASFTRQDLRAHYGLKSEQPDLWDSRLLRVQLDGLRTFLTVVVNVDREEAAAIGDTTWGNHTRDISCFLGFCHRFKQVAAPSLLDYLNYSLWVSFLGFLLAKQVCKQIVASHTAVAIKAVRFLWKRDHIAGTASELDVKVEQYNAWLKKLRDALMTALNRKRLAQEETSQNVVDRVDLKVLVQAIEDFRLETIAEFGKSGFTFHNAVSIQTAIIQCLHVGYIPPIRTSILCDLLPPDAPGPCRVCNEPDCKGNRVIVIRASERKRLGLRLPHHKVAGKWGGKPIQFLFPGELEQLVAFHITWGRETLLPSSMQGTPNLFVSPTNGIPFSESNWCQHWHKLMNQLVGYSVSPQKFRRIFVNDRRQHQEREGPTDKGAAMVMGNSVEQWDKVYDVHFSNREAQTAVDAMGCWRKALLTNE